MPRFRWRTSASRAGLCLRFSDQKSVALIPRGDFDSPLGNDGFSYFMIARPGISGIAFFGDCRKIRLQWPAANRITHGKTRKSRQLK